MDPSKAPVGIVCDNCHVYRDLLGAEDCRKQETDELKTVEDSSTDEQQTSQDTEKSESQELEDQDFELNTRAKMEKMLSLIQEMQKLSRQDRDRRLEGGEKITMSETAERERAALECMAQFEVVAKSAGCGRPNRRQILKDTGWGILI